MEASFWPSSHPDGDGRITVLNDHQHHNAQANGYQNIANQADCRWYPRPTEAMVQAADHEQCHQRQVQAGNNNLLHYSGLRRRPPTRPPLKHSGIRTQHDDRGDPRRKDKHNQKNPCLPVIERACNQKQHHAGRDKLTELGYQYFRSGFQRSSFDVRPVSHASSAQTA